MSDAESPKGTMELSCEDCMALMARYPDKHFDLAIVDPPYGINVGAMQLGKGKGTESRTWTKKEWDSAIPSPDYFAELTRVSREQIIWGGNYFPLRPTRCWIIWDKMQEFSGSEFEMAWVSLDAPTRAFRMSRVEAYAGTDRIHPTQKPVALYRWLLANYAKPGQRILDTHLGSGSHAIACHYFGAHLTACEIDADYFAAATARIQRETAQTTFL
jgi:site-specific DNA-methyltransferase (adenine-specific)